MITKHCFVSTLDVNEQLPFILKDTKDLPSKLRERQRIHNEIQKFIDCIQKNLNEKIYHIGSDILEDRSCERFMFEKSGFLELVIEAPVAINAHFHDLKRAKMFAVALKKTLRQILPKKQSSELLLRSIEIRDEHEVPMTYKDWKMMKNMRSILQRSVTIIVFSIFIFLILEIGKSVILSFAKSEINTLTGDYSMISQSTISAIMALILGMFIRPMQNSTDKILAKYVFKK